uniref:uncharacterized protein LOC120345347 n=1 Tax=Styela clava TaxID=7725 RepID=UPI00193AAE52|nr:uncharacterized protein LOC120345347 [Styela clava]
MKIVWIIFIITISTSMTTCKSLEEKKAKDDELKRQNYSFNIENSTQLKALNHICEKHPWLKSCIVACNETIQMVATASVDIKNKNCGELTDLTQEVLAAENVKEEDQNEPVTKKRRKRSSSIYNPCTASSPASSVIVYANDTDGNEVEVYQDVNNHLYKTFYLFGCITPALSTTGYECRLQHIMHKAAVFPPDSYTLEVRNIWIPATCVLMR